MLGLDFCAATRNLAKQGGAICLREETAAERVDIERLVITAVANQEMAGEADTAYRNIQPLPESNVDDRKRDRLTLR